MKEIKLLLCEVRHSHPEIEGLPSVFPTTISDPTDVSGLELVAEEAIGDADSVILYVTGLTVCVGAVIRVCAKAGKHLSLYHYDRSADCYYRQELF